MNTCIIIMVWGLYESMHAHKPVAFCSTCPQKSVYTTSLSIDPLTIYMYQDVPGPIGKGWPMFDVSY